MKSQPESCQEGLDVVHHLISAGCDVNKANKSGWTPLHQASRLGYQQLVRFLLDYGAEMKTSNDTMVAKMVAVLVHVHCAARESKYIKNSIHKCCNVTLLRGIYCCKHMHLFMLCLDKELSLLCKASMTTLTLIRENLRGL